ncbi:hypothetical protein B0H17DRAFT_1179940 [Mycena rosella]|uniref:Uncharacterized protein n=1 Tax=Mycena rosella TaxID=1033263 RepID=A0AAD7DFZ9_MYCRO|nr:hypothetical protein B0H17DRAFT_1179940 [Mycena rosella]
MTPRPYTMRRSARSPSPTEATRPPVEVAQQHRLPLGLFLISVQEAAMDFHCSTAYDPWYVLLLLTWFIHSIVLGFREGFRAAIYRSRFGSAPGSFEARSMTARRSACRAAPYFGVCAVRVWRRCFDARFVNASRGACASSSCERPGSCGAAAGQRIVPACMISGWSLGGVAEAYDEAAPRGTRRASAVIGWRPESSYNSQWTSITLCPVLKSSIRRATWGSAPDGTTAHSLSKHRLRYVLVLPLDRASGSGAGRAGRGGERLSAAYGAMPEEVWVCSDSFQSSERV